MKESGKQKPIKKKNDNLNRFEIGINGKDNRQRGRGTGRGRYRKAGKQMWLKKKNCFENITGLI